MEAPRMRIAHLDEDRLAKLQTLEKEVGAVIVALEPQYVPAPLTGEQVEKLRAMEEELGVVLLAYNES